MLLSVFANLDWNRGSHKVERSVRSYRKDYSHLVKMVSQNAKLTSCNPDPFFISFLRLVESKLNLVSWFSTSRSGCVQPVRIVEILSKTAKMLGVRLDFGFTLYKWKSLLELIQKALQLLLCCRRAAELVVTDAEPLLTLSHRGKALMGNIARLSVAVKAMMVLYQ